MYCIFHDVITYSAVADFLFQTAFSVLQAVGNCMWATGGERVSYAGGILASIGSCCETVFAFGYRIVFDAELREAVMEKFRGKVGVEASSPA